MLTHPRPEFVFEAYVDEITCMDEDGVRFDVYTDDNIPTKHCYLPAETINKELVVITPYQQYKIQGILYNEIEINITRCKNISTDNNIITTNLVLRGLYDEEKDAFPIALNNTPAYIYSDCSCLNPLVVGKRYVFKYTVVDKELVVNECVVSDVHRDLMTNYVLDHRIDEKDIDTAVRYERMVIESLKGKPALKFEASGYIKKNTDEEFELRQNNGNIFPCIVLNYMQNHFQKRVIDDSFKTVTGYISKGKIYVTNCFDVQKRLLWNKRIYIKK